MEAGMQQEWPTLPPVPAEPRVVGSWGLPVSEELGCPAAMPCCAMPWCSMPPQQPQGECSPGGNVRPLSLFTHHLWMAPESPGSGSPSCFSGRAHLAAWLHDPMPALRKHMEMPVLWHRDWGAVKEAGSAAWLCCSSISLFSLAEQTEVPWVSRGKCLAQSQSAQGFFLTQGQGSKHGWGGRGLHFTAQLLSCTAPKASTSVKSSTGRDEKVEGRRTGGIFWLSSSKQSSATSNGVKTNCNSQNKHCELVKHC